MIAAGILIAGASLLAAPMVVEETFWNGKNRCGPAVLVYAAEWCGKPVGPSEVNRWLPEEDVPVSLVALATAARGIGLKCFEVSFSPAADCSGFLPMIATVQFSQDRPLHYVLVVEADSESLVLLDPAFGCQKVNKDWWRTHWTGLGIVLRERTWAEAVVMMLPWTASAAVTACFVAVCWVGMRRWRRVGSAAITSGRAI